LSLQRHRQRNISRDNATDDVTNPQSWNMYSYTLNNPMAFVDPTGLFTAVPCDANGLNPNDGSAAAAEAAEKGL
jgi:hypothetical protein